MLKRDWPAAVRTIADWDSAFPIFLMYFAPLSIAICLGVLSRNSPPLCGKVENRKESITMELLAMRQMPFYFKTNDKVAWIALENINLVVIVRTSDVTENDYSQGATKKIDIAVKFLDLETGEIVREFGHKLVFHCPLLELVCDLTLTSVHPLLNVFARLEDFQSRVIVFSCITGEELKKEAEISVKSCSQRGSNFRWGTSVRFLKASPLRNDQYWLAVVLSDGEFLLFKMTVTQKLTKDADHIAISCTGSIRSSELNQVNAAFSWSLLDFSPDQKHVTIIGRGAYVFFCIGLVILDLDFLNVVAEEQLKGFHSVLEAKYSAEGNFFLALCSGERITRNQRGAVDFESSKSVVIWDAVGNLLHKINFLVSEVSATFCFEVFSSPHDNYIIIPQTGVNSMGNQFSVFFKHTLDFSQPESQLCSVEILRIHHEKGTDNYTSCFISPSGHQLLVIHCYRKNVDDENEEASNLMVYRMNNSPADLKVLCRIAVRNHYAVQKLRLSHIPKEMLSFLNWS